MGKPEQVCGKAVQEQIAPKLEAIVNEALGKKDRPWSNTRSMASSAHADCNMIGPGVAVDKETTLALLASHLNLHAGMTPDFLIPHTATKMIQTLYRWGARNCELIFHQVLGQYRATTGISMPTFLPEST